VTRKGACVRRGAPSRRRTRSSSLFSATPAALQVSRRDLDPRYESGQSPEPDQDPQDPYVFGPPGSRSISTRYGSGSGSFYNQAKTL
jgi:hypothetical protein